MKLYHGSNVVVQSPDVDHSREKIDFGRGFYVTPIREQAVKWAERFKDGGGSLGYARTPFTDIQVGGGIVQLAVALEKTPSLTNEWTEVKLQSKDVEVDANGHIVITHETGDGAQGFYIMEPTK